jgi:adenine-specific DNA methylase
MLKWSKQHIGLLSAESYSRFNVIAREPNKLNDNVELRKALLDFIADFANWDNSTASEYLETSHKLTQAAHEALGGAPGTRPLVVDPFAGGGAIPLEALRVGAEVFASDVNPVAVLLNKVVLEYIPRYGQELANGVREWGAWIKKQAEKQLSEFYPKDPDGATPIAYLWARMITCEGPSCGAKVPLLRTLKLNSNDSLRVLPDRKKKFVELELIHKAKKNGEGTVRSGAATCPVCGFTTSAARVKIQLIAQHGGANKSRIVAVYTGNGERRRFRLPDRNDTKAFDQATKKAKRILAKNPEAFPTEEINPIRPYANTRGLSAVTRIGCSTFSDLYNLRQALSIITFYRILDTLQTDSANADKEFSTALKTALALAINRAVSQNTSVSRWDSSRSTIKGAFSKQALAVVWDFAEANPFSGGSADWDGALDWVIRFIEANAQIRVPGTVVHSSATSRVLPMESASALITDPPYFAAIPYSDLSDFFYVWLRRGLKQTHPELFLSPLTVKDEELIVTNAQRTRRGKVKDSAFFRNGMTAALTTARETVMPNGIGVVVYAEGTTSGWEAILAAIIDAGWIVTSSWPIDTEMSNRTQAQGSASLQSSVHIVCRPRENADGSLRVDDIGDWRDVLRKLPMRIHEWMPRLTREGVVGADAIFACLGPALEVFSRYSRVEKASGELVPLHEYLEYVWAAVAKEALTMIFAGADATGFEEDARLTAMWLWTLSPGPRSTNGSPKNGESSEEETSDDEEDSGKAAKTSGYVLEYDAARKIAQGLGAHLEELSSLVEVKGDKARLLPVAERTKYLFGAGETEAPSGRKKRKAQQKLFHELEELDEPGGWGAKGSPTLGDTALDRIHQSMILFAAGRTDALRRFLVEDGAGSDERFWRLANALSALYPASGDEKRWVDGVLAKKKSFGF